jgi:GST-like protein
MPSHSHRGHLAADKGPHPVQFRRLHLAHHHLLDVLHRHLSERQYLCGDEYTIADMANYAWYGGLVAHNIYEAAEFLDVGTYTHVLRWVKDIKARPAVQRGRRENKSWGPEEERHSASDFAVPVRLVLSK